MSTLEKLRCWLRGHHVSASWRSKGLAGCACGSLVHCRSLGTQWSDADGIIEEGLDAVVVAP